MCGIIAYIGQKNCIPTMLDGLSSLEYRGYDSAGLSFIDGTNIETIKAAGGVSLLKDKCMASMLSYCGIAHTRWATHGKPSIENAHPHVTQDGRLAIVHNGIIENYEELKNTLPNHYLFKSSTDTEVLLYVIYNFVVSKQLSVFEATKLALEQVVGAYAIVVLDRDNPSSLVCARKGGSLVIGKGNNEYYIASDKVAIDSSVTDILYLQDNTICEVSDTIFTYDMSCGIEIDCEIEKVYDHRLPIDKGAYEFFMLKEIYEQPDIVTDCISGRIHTNRVKLGGLIGYEDHFASADCITLVACGSSWHAALLGKYYIEELSNKKVYVEYASEYRYRTLPIRPNDIVIGISQSGETADTIAAIEKAKINGAITVGICNVPNSSLARTTECGIFLRCGVEVGVASTKSFINQSVVMLLLAIWMSQSKNDAADSIVKELLRLPNYLRNTLDCAEEVGAICESFKDMTNCLFLGRGYNFPIALEGALKLKEISYVHAEGYPAAEMKHGPIALIDEHMPVVVIANNNDQLSKLKNNIKEIQARNGKVILISNEDWGCGDYTILVPKCSSHLSPMIATIPLQLLAYYSANRRGFNVDKPRNLAKSVTVE